MPFQNKINYQQAPAVEGDFCSANPYASYPAGEGQLIAGDEGVNIGKFAWIDATTGEVSNKGTGAPAGFIHREGQAFINDWLAESSMLIPKGYPVTVHIKGDYWVRPTTAAKAGDKVSATADGSASVGNGTETPWTFVSAGAAGELCKISSWV